MTVSDYIGRCITHVRPINRARVAAATGLCGAELERLINRCVIAFCLKSMGSTGWQYGDAHRPRSGRIKSREVLTD